MPLPRELRRTYRFTGARFTVHRDLSPDALLRIVFEQASLPWQVWDAAFRVPLGPLPNRVLAACLAQELNHAADRRHEQDVGERLAMSIRCAADGINRTHLHIAESRALLDGAKRRLARATLRSTAPLKASGAGDPAARAASGAASGVPVEGAVYTGATAVEPVIAPTMDHRTRV
jgi:hypothetical protein